MSEIETRLRQNYPAILMTLISLVVALVFEMLISGMSEREALWSPTVENLFLWAQFIFLATTTLMFWFTRSLHSASMHVLFSPRDIISVFAGAIAYFVMAANLGTTAAVVWMYAAAGLFAAAWQGFREYGHVYLSDPASSGDLRTHRIGGRLMLAGAGALGGFAILLQLGMNGAGAAGAALLVGVGLGTAAHFRWYAEWRGAVGLLSLSDEQQAEEA